LLNQKEKESDIIEKLASNEELVAKLYKAYADAFPNLRGFWDSLATEEIKHALWIRSLGAKTGTSQIFVDEGRFNIIAIQTFMKYMDKELARLNEQKIPLIEALSIAFYIEQSLIENKYFEVFKTDSAELQHTLKRLHDDTLAHRNKTKEELEKYKKSQ